MQMKERADYYICNVRGGIMAAFIVICLLLSFNGRAQQKLAHPIKVKAYAALNTSANFLKGQKTYYKPVKAVKASRTCNKQQPTSSAATLARQFHLDSPQSYYAAPIGRIAASVQWQRPEYYIFLHTYCLF
jgi:hypothetical protein